MTGFGRTGSFLALNKGLLIRPMGDCLYLMPPLTTPPEKVFEAVEIIVRLLGQD